MGTKILLVDDDPELSTCLKSELEALGHQVKICDNGDEVLGTLNSYKPDLLIMDVMLPGIDGYSLTSHISEDPEMSKMPLIIMSALTTSRSMFEGFPQVAAFFSKPFSSEEFMEAVKTALTKKE